MTTHEVELNELIRQRWSPRAFAETAIEERDLQAVLEAARWAPSSMNEQPWDFIVADRTKDPAAHARIVGTLMPANAEWARHAPVLMVAVARTSFSRSGAPNRWALYDVGQAVAQLVLQATALGLSVHQMGGFDVAAAVKVLGIPAGHEAVAVIALGYRGDAAELNEQLRAREAAPRVRRPVSEWVHEGLWAKGTDQASRG